LGYHTKLDTGVVASDVPESEIKHSNIAKHRENPPKITKIGTIICDEATVGASSVLKSGTVVDFCAYIPPLTSASGYYKPFYGVK
jgi:hypothetical protein